MINILKEKILLIFIIIFVIIDIIINTLWTIIYKSIDTLIYLCIFRYICIFIGGGIAIYVGNEHKKSTLNTPLIDTSMSESIAAANDILLTKQSKILEKKGHFRRNIILSIMFFVTTLCSVYTGVRCVTQANGAGSAKIGILMASLICLMNLEFMLMKSLITSITSSPGILLRRIHNHPLHFTSSAVAHSCDVCNGRNIKDGESYRCMTCDFDLCLNCYKKCGTKFKRGEGLLRGDKGPKDDVPLSTWAYFVRALQLTLPFAHVVIVAFICVIISQAATLAIPSFQGRILDDVIRVDQNNFRLNVFRFVIFSLATGLFGSIQSLCVEIIGRRLSVAVRTELFKNIIRQDIAFFDGTVTGQLMSLMTSDAQAMVQPCRSLVNNLLSNLLLLVGGLIMCTSTSWKLTILAVTSIGPIVYLTGLYARWSRGVNKHIWSALAQGNGVATEAVSNIRTVRAFGSDAEEFNKYNVAAQRAYSKGLLDAYVSALTYAITSYMDKIASVLILWYGGSVVLASRGEELSLGSLITFQLYWNMMNNAYKSLSQVVNSLARAAAAAQRVFSVLDCTPDLEDTTDLPKIGQNIVKLDTPFDVSFNNVQFTYQMRPDAPVLKTLNFHIPEGTMCALVGRSGGGKSTIIHLLLRFYDPQEGSINIGGVPLKNFYLKSYRGSIGLVSQDTSVFAGTVRENISYGLKGRERLQMRNYM
eukprot:GHVL01021534.1.p1 GENE.GHVL01021534.1~~GHVL01021534.1.p1  ORF type:complete len:702 (-),score=98.20 GHVL01021534.1:223-2328(-)